MQKIRLYGMLARTFVLCLTLFFLGTSFVKAGDVTNAVELISQSYTNKVKIGDFIFLTISNPDPALQLTDTNKFTLLLDDQPFPNLCRSIVPLDGKVYKLQFQLAFGASNRAAWSAVFANIWSGNKPEVGLLFSNNVKRGGVGKDFKLYLRAFDPTHTTLAFGLLILFAYIFLYLATQTNMIRDAFRSSSAQDAVSKRKRNSIWEIILCSAFVVGVAFYLQKMDINQDNRITEKWSKVYIVAIFCWIALHCSRYWLSKEAVAASRSLRTYSLARTQMALWFFLVICCWVFLWLLTGATDTLSDTVLALMGIGAGTALGTEVQAASNPNPPVDELDTKIKELIANINELVAKINELKAKPQPLPDDDAAELAVSQGQLAKLQDQLAKSKGQLKELIQTKDFFDDILTDGDGISFHRFQMFAWTIVLGLVFVVKVWQELAMPEFSTTLLALMGICSGTYLGFMIKETHSASK